MFVYEEEKPVVKKADSDLHEKSLYPHQFEMQRTNPLSYTRTNHTGIPSPLKKQFEERSGISFDDVRVHYNSSSPVKFGALAYTCGNQVHIGPGQERHLAHELGHVVQQKQGRVKRTGYINGVAVNTDSKLEGEADQGLVQMKSVQESDQTVIQCMIIFNGKAFTVDKDREPITTMDRTPGTDRSHTVSDRDIQLAVAGFLNALLAGGANLEEFMGGARDVAGGDLDISEEMEGVQKAIIEKDIEAAVQLGNKIYDKIANSRFNLRPGNFSGNRSAGQNLDLLGGEFLDFTPGATGSAAQIKVQVSAVDAQSIMGILQMGRTPSILIKDGGFGGIASSTEGKYPGHGLLYNVVNLEFINELFYVVTADLSS